MKYIKVVLFISLSFNFLNGQKTLNNNDTIRIKNGSFEETNLEESGWIIMGDQRFSPPDVHTLNEVLQNVNSKATHGENFLSMVTRNNDSNEQIAQFLETPLQAGQKYALKLSTMRSTEYLGMSADGLKEFKKPIHLRIYGLNILNNKDIKPSNWKRDKTDLLFLSEEIQSEEWKEEVIFLKPLKTTNFLIFEAFWHTPTLLAYNGHLLLDNISHLVKIYD